jgi:hypothetical protein
MSALPERMRAWQVNRPGQLHEAPLQPVELRVPTPAPDELLVRVSACGVCRTDLHVVMGDLPMHRSPVTPGHEIVGRVVTNGSQASRFQLGERVGIAWLRHTCSRCRFCTTGRENLCLDARFTGWDDDGGYAEFATVPEAYAYRIPDQLDDITAAPLLCAGIIGFRSLERADLPTGGRLGIYGFGASAHLLRKSRSTEERPSTCSRALQKLERSPWSSGARRPVTRRTPRPSPSTRPFCSLRRASSCRLPWPHSIGAERWRSPASTSAMSPRSTTGNTV